jgi:hypothetical protein
MFPRDKRVLTPVILRLNKTIYDEALGLLYSHKFSFADTNALHDFLTQIGPRMRPKLRVLEVAEWGYSTAHKAMNYPAMSLLGDAVNLESVWLNICHWEVSRTRNFKNPNLSRPLLTLYSAPSTRRSSVTVQRSY